ncbi:MAG: threonine-phosphate decarboxylase [Sneathiella sp.]|nr:threonine-phosphate decarboxylase [Sneathiella sp.]
MTQQFTQTYNRVTFHGGDLTWAKRYFGSDGLPWIDLSTGINPHAYPLPQIPTEIWTRLPGASIETDLLQTAKHYYKNSDKADIVACPGTQSALQLLPHLRDPAEVAILSPTYAEHAKCWKAAGHTVLAVDDLQDVPSSVQIIVVVTPNNPTGKIIEIEVLKDLQQRLEKRGGLLVLDEAFMDLTPTHSYAPHLPAKGVLILKSFGKFFGLAGLRLGFVLGDADMVSKIKEQLGPWAVSGPAAFLGITALADTNWTENMKEKLHQQTRKLEKILIDTNLPIVGSTNLFTLVQTDQATTLFNTLGESRILTRPFPDFPDYLRFGLPGESEQWDRLQNTLSKFENQSLGIEKVV